MDDEAVKKVTTVGGQLKAARKKKKLSLEDIASQTRIPLRHLQSLEDSDWANLPAPTYSVGFAKSYAGAVDLDRHEIGERLRAEMGHVRMEPMAPAEVFEPADPARTMPKWLVLGGIAAAILLVLLMRWWSNRELYGADEGAPANVVATAPATPAPTAAPSPQGPVVLSASEPLWMAVKDSGQTLFAGILKPGTDFTVPPNAVAPVLGTAKPEALTIRVGTATAPAVGAPGASVTDVSLLPADLMKTGAAQPAPAAAAPPPPTAVTAPAAQSRPRRAAPTRPAPSPAPTPAPEPAPAVVEPAPGNTAG